jgi:hypothetical protein
MGGSGFWRAQGNLFGQMAGDLLTIRRGAQGRNLVPAALHSVDAARMKDIAYGRIQRARRVTLQQRSPVARQARIRRGAAASSACV